MENTLINKFKNLIKTNKKYHFIFFFALFLLVLFILWFATKDLNLSKPYSILASKILDNYNIQNNVFFNGSNYGLQIYEMKINILDVCTGLFELCVFVALIFSTLLVSFKNKLFGTIILIIIFLTFNLFRIIFMICLLQTTNIYLVDVIHTILFKLGFFLLFIVYYFIWLSLSKSDKNEI